MSDAVALAGEIVREVVEAVEADPGTLDMLGRISTNIAATQVGFDRAALAICGDGTIRQTSMEGRFGFWADSRLEIFGCPVDAESCRRVIEETVRAMQDAAVERPAELPRSASKLRTTISLASGPSMDVGCQTSARDVSRVRREEERQLSSSPSLNAHS